MGANKQIDVAVAVIHYQDQYLLGFRNAKQHQGNRYEFVGGKIEADEPARQALIREVNEEVGLGLKYADDKVTINKMGLISHCYKDDDQGSKTVRLHVYRIGLIKEQYEALKIKKQGEEGQPLCWVSHNELLSGKYPLPEANKVILDWLRLPDHLAITHAVADFSEIQQWLDFYIDHLPPDACVYIRHKLAVASLPNGSSQLVATMLDQQLVKDTADVLNHQDDGQQVKKAVVLLALLQALITARKDIRLILGVEDFHSIGLLQKYYAEIYHNIFTKVVAQHVNERQLIESIQVDNAKGSQNSLLLTDMPITLSCHNSDSLQRANHLSAQRMNQQQASVVAAFISPVCSTKTHPDAQALGWRGFADLAQQTQMPVVALGGIKPQDLVTARQYGADKVAGIRSFVKSS